MERHPTRTVLPTNSILSVLQLNVGFCNPTHYWLDYKYVTTCLLDRILSQDQACPGTSRTWSIRCPDTLNHKPMPFHLGYGLPHTTTHFCRHLGVTDTLTSWFISVASSSTDWFLIFLFSTCSVPPVPQCFQNVVIITKSSSTF
jgi:hypothetical protein